MRQKLRQRNGTMAIRIYDESQPDDDVYLRLEEAADGAVDLVVVDPDTGHPIVGGFMLQFNPDGKIIRRHSFDYAGQTPFETEVRGKVIIDGVA